MLDIHDSFYKDICTPYKSEKNTDVLLSDRIKDFYPSNYTAQHNILFFYHLQVLKFHIDILAHYNYLLKLYILDKEEKLKF